MNDFGNAVRTGVNPLVLRFEVLSEDSLSKAEKSAKIRMPELLQAKRGGGLRTPILSIAKPDRTLELRVVPGLPVSP